MSYVYVMLSSPVATMQEIKAKREMENSPLFALSEQLRRIVFDAQVDDARIPYIRNGEQWIMMNAVAPSEGALDAALEQATTELLDDQGNPYTWSDVGAWNEDGTQLGQYRTPLQYDEEGNVAGGGEIVGTPKYPLSTEMKGYLTASSQDDVTHDADGNETSRAPATAPKQGTLIYGQSTRDFN